MKKSQLRPLIKIILKEIFNKKSTLIKIKYRGETYVEFVAIDKHTNKELYTLVVYNVYMGQIPNGSNPKISELIHKLFMDGYSDFYIETYDNHDSFKNIEEIPNFIIQKHLKNK